MDEDESLRRYGLSPGEPELTEIRGLLQTQAVLQQHEQDNQLMRICCVQLFHAGHLSDVLPIWRAKESSWDAHCVVDVQLLCGAGLDATKAYLDADGSADAAEALEYLLRCEAAGDFDDFSPAAQSRREAAYYVDEPE